MKMILGNRGSGKTTKAIATAYANNAILIVGGSRQAKAIKAKAEQIGMNIEVVGMPTYLEGIKNDKYLGKPVVIDELDYVLSSFIEGSVLACTSSCDVDILEGGISDI